MIVVDFEYFNDNVKQFKIAVKNDRFPNGVYPETLDKNELREMGLFKKYGNSGIVRWGYENPEGCVTCHRIGSGKFYYWSPTGQFTLDDFKRQNKKFMYLR